MVFAEIRDLLLDHLPRVIADGPISVTPNSLRIDERGVSVGDVSDMLADLTGHRSFVPDGFPLRDVTLRDLVLERTPDDDDAFSLSFVIDWAATEITVADGLSLHTASSNPLRAVSAEFEWTGGRLFADLDVVLQIEDMVLDARLELPSQIVTLDLSPAEADKAAPYLANKGLVNEGGSHTLERFFVSGSIPYRHFTMRIELRDLFEIGPVRLRNADAELVLGRSTSDIQFGAHAVLDVDLSDTTTLTVEAEGFVDSHGWRVSGALDLSGRGHSIGDLLAKATPNGQTAPALPSIIADVSLSHLGIEIDTFADQFVFECALDWQGDDADLAIRIEKSSDALQVSGTLTLGNVVFRMIFDKAANAVLVASYDAAGSKGLTLDEMLAAAGVDTAAAFGPGGSGISLDAKAVGVAFQGKDKILLAADVEAGVDLSKLGELPVLGPLLPDAGKIGVTLQPYYKSKQFDADETAKDLLPDALGLGEGTLSPGFNLSAKLDLGTSAMPLPDVELSSPQEIAPPKDTSNTATSAQPPHAGLDWIDVNHSMGPVKIERVGWALSDDKDSIDIAFDGDLSVAGLTLSLIGLGAKYTFSNQSVVPHLQGLGLDFRKGPLSIGGGFLNNDGDFAGKVLIGTKQFSLSALGAFTMLEGTPSMFVFGVLGMPLGGPVFFFVEGLAAGFGVHRRIKAPKISEVRKFPLIAAANETAVGSKPDPDPTAQLRSLSAYIEPELGQYFFAAGIKFNSFRLLHGTLVAIASFGRDFEIDVVGTANFTTPPDLPKNVPALARVELDLVARIAPDEGIIAVEAQLNPKSYVYSPLCHLSGGFAYKAWFKGDHAGDFVLSVGGYAPQFKKPAHYPDVPRVALKYQIADGVYIKGDGYFAMTPSAMMAGGGLHANVEIDSLHAWADFTIDMIVRWEPFHYDAWMHIGIGAKWKCFHTTASADLHIWGPKFSGSAHVEWSVFSFDVEFGPRQAHLPLPISFDRFKTAFLGWDKTQESLDATLGLVIADGTIGHIDDVAVVAGSKLKITTSSKVPLTKATLGDKGAGVRAPQNLGIAPTGGGALGSAVHEITITRDGDPAAAKLFKIDKTPLTSGVPAALWGTSFDAKENAPPIQAATGITLSPDVHFHEGKSKEVSAEDFWLATPHPVVQAPAARRMMAAPSSTATRPTADETFKLILVKHGDKKIDVIKEIRGMTGLGLKQAKNLTESGGEILDELTAADAKKFAAKLERIGAAVRLEGTSSGAPLIVQAGNPGQFNAVLVSTDNKIATIKLVREITGFGLKEAKDMVEGNTFSLPDLPASDALDVQKRFDEVGAIIDLIPQKPKATPSIPLPDKIPLSDLKSLNLDVEDIVIAPLRNTRQTIALKPGGFANA
ncbi:ribosomal protein L7/L12 [Thalassococcus lentus]|uniref:ribosomal protein L7/L12 n=1 Tax=Thalassococcus lentus TaxID=1210524 RepID=UPI0038CD990D